MEFNFKKLFAAAAIGISMASPTSAAVLTFDDVGSFSPVGAGYGGLNWSNFFALNGADYHPGSGYDRGTVSGSHVAFNSFASPAETLANGSNATFDFNGVYFTAAWNNNLNITVNGYLDGVLRNSRTVAVSTSSPTYFAFDFLGVDRLVFTSFGGTDAGLGGGGEHFAMDNFTFNETGTAIPEPATLALVAGGLVGIGTMRRRRNRD